MTDVVSRARSYLLTIPPAVSGQGGHNLTFKAACALWNGFGLSDSDTYSLLCEYNARCVPPWTERELAHKVKSASTSSHQKPRGHLLGNNGHQKWNEADHKLVAPPSTEPKKQAPKPKYQTDRPVEMPEPMTDPTRRFLMAVFIPEEGIGIEVGVLNSEQRCIPKGRGTTYRREEWIRKLDELDGDPNKLFEVTKDKCGAFIRINPIQLGGSKDADVTAFRHALLEFDHCSVEEQWNLITQSNIPCSAVLHSGNKSLHAWVKVDAKDRLDYALRVKKLYDHFADYGIDDKNKNPSRFSRLPGMDRGKRRQELLALKIGAPSFDQWLIDKETDGIGQYISLAVLLDFDSTNDPNTVLGERWLCKGGSCLWVGQAGLGKSSLAMQAAINWALGRHFFGVYPVKPLRSLIIQAENDIGDLSEMTKGVILGLGITQEEIAAVTKGINENIIIIRDQVHTGRGFTVAAQRLIERHKPDLVWIDPLLSYVGDDVSSQKVCSEFLRNWLNPISEATGVVWMVLHHTGKPSTDPKARKGWTNSDYSYIGTGSSELTNWARAVNVLKKVDDELFHLMFAKRGRRAKAKASDGRTCTADIYLRHSDTGICWIQVDEPVSDVDEAEEKQSGRKAKQFNAERFLFAIAAKAMRKTEIVRRIQEFGNISNRTAWERFKDIENRLTFDPKTELYTA